MSASDIINKVNVDYGVIIFCSTCFGVRKQLIFA